MNQNYKKYLIALTLLFVLGLSAITNITVYADEATPEAPVISEETIEVTDQESAEEEAPQPTPEVDSESETSDLTENVENIIESLPENTGLIVLDEEGTALPLASEEAEQAIIVGDPIWCPATVAVPTPDLNGCTASHGTFAALLADPVLNVVGLMGVGPTVDGVIWIASNYNGADNSAIVIDGGTFTAMNDFKLTLKGGWCDGTDVTCVGLIDKTKPSIFDVPLSIIGWNNDVTISDIAVQGNTLATTDALLVATTGNITVTRVSVENNTDGGARFSNSGASTPKNVTVTDSNFSNNGSVGTTGLEILSKGIITLKNITADTNGAAGSGYGIVMNNSSATTAQAVNLTNISVNNNRLNGLFVNSNGLITVTDITATNNGLGLATAGVEIINNNIGFTSGVTLAGTNLFHSNNGIGLSVLSNGVIKASNLHAVDNNNIGVLLDNDGAATPQAVTLTGSSIFKFNNNGGLSINSLGTVTLNNITASFNSGYGAFIDNHFSSSIGDVKLTGNNTFFDNADTGLIIYSKDMILLNNINASQNGNFGVSLDNTSSSLFKAVTLTGTNIFDTNLNHGLSIFSDGVVTINNITSINNNAYGVNIDNSNTATTPKAVFVNGTNNLSDNTGTGLFVESYGAITVSNLTANFNGGYGTELRNDIGTLTPAPVTLNGNNTFNGNDDLGLYVVSLGAIKTNNLIAKDTTNGGGVLLQNNDMNAVGDVIMLGVNQFTDNDSHNLSISSKGNITLSNVIATGSATGFGVNIDNNSASTPKNVTISGTNFINDNASTGLIIYSMGVISLNNVSVNNNGAGAYLDNGTFSLIAKDVKLTGTNTFSNNAGTGLTIFSRGNIVVNNLTANDNYIVGSYGAYINNDYLGSVGNVTLSGTNKLNNNNETNLHIESYGVVTINNLTANSSDTNAGAYIINTNPSSASKTVTLTGINTFSQNYNTGLIISSQGVITTNNITATSNGIIASGNGVSLSNASTNLAGITMNGTNVITDNKSTNLEVSSLGNIKINNLNASESLSGSGAFISNDFVGATGNVTLTGTNQFLSNLAGVGLQIQSRGSITISNVTAEVNSIDGVYLYNLGSTELVTNKPITITGYIVTKYNGSDGLEITTYSNIIINNLASEDNNSYGVDIDQDHPSSITPVNITINGTNNISFNSFDGLNIVTLGTVTLNNMNASSNGNVGVLIDANSPTATGAVIIKGVNTFNDNSSIGLLIDSNGAVTLSSITANGNTSHGVDIENNTSATASPVTLTGTNTFNGNGGIGLLISSKGAITVNALTANENNSTGAVLANGGSPTFAGVTLTGKNTFISNTTGLFIQTSGTITTNNITANENSSHGVSIDNTFDATASSITMKGINTFSYNGGDGLLIFSNGAVTLTKFTADGNSSNGVTISFSGAGGNVSLTCGSTNDNGGTGLAINLNAPFTATITGLVSLGNVGSATSLMGTGTYNQLRGCPLP